MSSFGERLKSLRKEHDLTQEDLGKILNVKKAAISKYELDKVSMNLDSIRLLAQHFRIPINYFLDETPPIFEKRIVRLPVIGSIRAGIPLLAQENIEGYLELPNIMSGDYILQVIGNSMIGAGILDGDLAVCKQAEIAKSGQIVVAATDLSTGFSATTVKYYFEENNDGPWLKPANPNYSNLNMKDGYRIVGTMVSLLRKEAPNYQLYKAHFAMNNNAEWTEVINLATQSGLKVNQVREILAAQIEIAKKLKNLD